MNTMAGKRSILHQVNPHAGLWDYDGACAPKESGYSHQMTFSVACFQWVPMARGKLVKRAKSVKRFSGPTSNPQAIYDKAEAFCVAKESGTLNRGAEQDGHSFGHSDQEPSTETAGK